MKLEDLGRCLKCAHRLIGKYYPYKYCSDCYVEFTNSKNSLITNLSKQNRI